MAGSPADGAFEQPFADSLFRTTTHLANLVQQGGHMNCVAEPSGQRRTSQLLNRFHGGTITWPLTGWRISFSAQNANCRGHFLAIIPTINSTPLFTTFEKEITIKTTAC
jgi:hypothetical protein